MTVRSHDGHVRRLRLRPDTARPARAPKPLRDPEVVLFSRVLNINYKKKSKARTAVSIQTCTAMFACGWDLSSRMGKWGRLHWLFLNVAMLRTGCAQRLIVVYIIVLDDNGDESVVFGEGTDVLIAVATDAPSGIDPRYVQIHVDADKNVRAWNRRHSYMPADVPALGALPADWVLDYILSVRPPSGMPLLAKPLTKGGFAKKPTSAAADIKKAYRRSCQLTGTPFDEDTFKLLGTHSGRKSLSQWLWEDGHCRLIADAGGWFLKRDAVDLYFKTARHTILAMVRGVGKALGLGAAE